MFGIFRKHSIAIAFSLGSIAADGGCYCSKSRAAAGRLRGAFLRLSKEPSKVFAGRYFCRDRR
jgi:hypothetical protein